nr:DUF1080 domain-containing protein [Luteitalea pratensis]
MVECGHANRGDGPRPARLHRSSARRRDAPKDLTGWTHVGPGSVVVENGLLKTVGGIGLLYYAGERFGDCVIRVVYRTTTVDDNSGIFVRIPAPPADPWQAVHSGYEIQILENFPANYVLSEHQKQFGTSWHTTGAIYSMRPAMAKPQKPVGEWNTMEIELREHSYEPVRGRRPDAGYIGIQNHHEPQTVLFREITVIR